MLSVALYGRNDSYGYNLHKRAAISINCIAEVLTAPGDEIIFVDYNTPDDFPTFPEAIADTLTYRAKKLLRILRVRPSQHERFRHRTALVALEPVARNVAVRRSNPDNRWILSTNTDMVFVPKRAASLSDIVGALPDAYYHLPRFEIPEPLWESLDRLDPAGTIAKVDTWGRMFHLDEIVYTPFAAIKYDGPGDFQLVLRSDVWHVHGFNESMLRGWHVDSNLALRLALLPRQMGEVASELSGYHCDHTRLLTPAHQHRSTQNDWQAFIVGVKSPYPEDQASTWGLAGESVDELNVDTTSRVYMHGLHSAMPPPLVAPTEFTYASKVDERLDYSVGHVIPFLAGIIASYPRETVLGWLGIKNSLLTRFASLWKAMGFSGQIMVLKEARCLGGDIPSNCTGVTSDVAEECCNVFVFDFGKPEGEQVWSNANCDAAADVVASGFRRMVRRERLRLRRDPGAPRRFIGVNTVINSDVGAVFDEEIAAVATPAGTHIKHGFVSESRKPQDGLVMGELECMPMLIVGTAGTLAPAPGWPRENAIHAKLGVSGTLSYGPYFSVLPGSYEATFEFYVERTERGAGFSIDVATQRGKRILAKQRIQPRALPRYLGEGRTQAQEPLTCVLGFDVTPDATKGDEESIEFRVWSPGTLRFCLVALRLRQLSVCSQDLDGTVPRSP